MAVCETIGIALQVKATMISDFDQIYPDRRCTFLKNNLNFERLHEYPVSSEFNFKTRSTCLKIIDNINLIFDIFIN